MGRKATKPPRIGTRFGSRVVRGHLGVRPSGGQRVVVECDCGQIAGVQLARLMQGHGDRCARCALLKKNNGIPIALLRRLLDDAEMKDGAAVRKALRKLCREWS